jgi:4-hydroxy-2-oxoheptanedioate aldolase
MTAFRKLMGAGPVIGPFSLTTDPALVEIMGWAGFDYVVLDLEHGPSSLQNLQNLVRAAEVAGIYPLVRTKEGNLAMIGEALDVGAGGVVVPQVASARQAEAAVRRARFAPRGERGVNPCVRAARYSAMGRFEYFSAAGEAVIVLQIEGRQAVENLDEILQVDGVDVLFVGPYDLSQSLGVVGQVDHPLVVETITRIVGRCVEKGVCAGLFCSTPEAARHWMGQGARFISYGIDTGLFTAACRSAVKEVREG